MRRPEVEAGSGLILNTPDGLWMTMDAKAASRRED
jgi:hypothetical protein